MGCVVEIMAAALPFHSSFFSSLNQPVEVVTSQLQIAKEKRKENTTAGIKQIIQVMQLRWAGCFHFRKCHHYCTKHTSVLRCCWVRFHGVKKMLEKNHSKRQLQLPPHHLPTGTTFIDSYAITTQLSLVSSGSIQL